jgi:hypothetical protein
MYETERQANQVSNVIDFDATGLLHDAPQRLHSPLHVLCSAESTAMTGVSQVRLQRQEASVAIVLEVG